MIILYWLYRNIFFDLRKISDQAYIEKISLCYFNDKIILPEIKVFYKYYFKDGLYYNSCYLNLIDFLEDPKYKIYLDSNGFPVLESKGKLMFSEEQIEHYILNKTQYLSIYLDPIEPYRSKVKRICNLKNKTKKNVYI